MTTVELSQHRQPARVGLIVSVPVVPVSLGGRGTGISVGLWEHALSSGRTFDYCDLRNNEVPISGVLPEHRP